MKLYYFYTLKALWDGQSKIKMYYGMSRFIKELTGKRSIHRATEILFKVTEKVNWLNNQNQTNVNSSYLEQFNIQTTKLHKNRRRSCHREPNVRPEACRFANSKRLQSITSQLFQPDCLMCLSRFKITTKYSLRNTFQWFILFKKMNNQTKKLSE